MHLKTLAEIAIEAGLVTKAGAAKAGRLSEERKLPLVVILIRELGLDELSLIGALRKQTRVPLLDPATVLVDPEALRLVPRDACARLRVLPIGVSIDGSVSNVLPPRVDAVVPGDYLSTALDLHIDGVTLPNLDEVVDGLLDDLGVHLREGTPTFGGGSR